MNILIVDDNRDLAESLSVMLEDENHHVSVTYSGEEALTFLKSNKFDLILLDMKLPDINGFNVFQKFRQESPQIPIIMVTGYRIDQLFAEAIDNCTIHIMRWPFLMDSLLEKLNQIKPTDILIIVDNIMEPLTNDIELFLTEKNNNLLIINDEQDAIKQEISTLTELILLNTKLPLTYSLNIYHNIINPNKRSPAIIITTLPDKNESSDDPLRSVNVTGCLFKPFEPEYLFHSINLFSHSISQH